MALQKKPKQVVRKKRVINPDGTYASGKKVGRPKLMDLTLTSVYLPPDLVAELKTISVLHCRGSISALIRMVLTNALPTLQKISEQANLLADKKRPHLDPGAKKRRRRKVEKPEEDIGFEVV
jgi:hypothetical protein